MNRVVHFELPVDQMERAKKFYGDCFGWKMMEYPDMSYIVVHTSPVNGATNMSSEPGTINGGITERDLSMPYPQIYIAVENIENAIKKVLKAGGTMVRDSTPVGDMGFVANFKDTEGNVIGLWQVK